MNKPYTNAALLEIDVVDLQLDPDNYRTGPQPGQHEAIQAMIEEQGDKIIELAEDILKIGLSPIELLAVCPTSEPGKFRVVEGNRRLTSLKLLNTPALAAGSKISKQISKIASANVGKIKQSWPCYLFSNKQEALVWIQRRHNPGMGGAATIPWSAIQNRRAQEDEGHRQNTLEVLDFVSKHGNLTSSEAEKLRKMPITNLERILEDAAALSLLGVEVRNRELVCKYDQAWTLNVLKTIVLEIASKQVKVAKLYNTDSRKKYVADKASAQTPPTKASEWAIVKSGDVAKPTTPSGPISRPRPTSSGRKTLIPTSCILQITNPRLNEIYGELRKKLKIDNVPNSVAVLFRVFVEFSAEHYLIKHKIPHKDELIAKLRVISDFMEKNNVMTKKELKPIRLATGSQHNVLSTNTLNAYVHNVNVLPNPSDLRRAWDSVQPFVEKLWA